MVDIFDSKKNFPQIKFGSLDLITYLCTINVIIHLSGYAYKSNIDI